MPPLIHVNPECLFISAIRVGQHADEVQASHASTGARIESAQGGLPGAAAAAMSAKLAKWQRVSAALHARLSNDCHAFRAGGQGYKRTDSANADAIAGVGAHGATTALSPSAL